MEQIFLFLKKIFFLTQNVSNVLTRHNKLKFQSLFKIRCLFYVIALSNVIYAVLVRFGFCHKKLSVGSLFVSVVQNR